MKDIQLLSDVDLMLSKCGRPLRHSDGTVFLPLPKWFFFQANHNASTTETEAREIFGDTVWMLRSYAIAPPANELYWRLEFPNGRYLQNQNRLMSQVAGTGSQRQPIVPDVPCAPGSRLLVTIDDRPTNNGNGAGGVTPVSMLFGGAYIYALLGSKIQPINPIRDAGLMKRYFETVNQNILAPEIAISLENDSTPPGYVDDEYTFTDPWPVNPGFTLASSGSLSTTRSVTISGVSFFNVRRLIFNVTGSGGLTGTLVVRVRDASGFNLTNDYIKVSQFSNAPYACDWPLCDGSNLIFDYSIVDQAGGPGTWTIQTFMKGIRRRKQ